MQNPPSSISCDSTNWPYEEESDVCRWVVMIMISRAAKVFLSKAMRLYGLQVDRGLVAFTGIRHERMLYRYGYNDTYQHCSIKSPLEGCVTQMQYWLQSVDSISCNFKFSYKPFLISAVIPMCPILDQHIHSCTLQSSIYSELRYKYVPILMHFAFALLKQMRIYHPITNSNWPQRVLHIIGQFQKAGFDPLELWPPVTRCTHCTSNVASWL